jgi:glycine dehydrogenase subunit 1
MHTIPLTEEECRQMLETIGISSIDELLTDIPAARRLKKLLNLPPAMCEQNLVRFMNGLASINTVHDSVPCFLGAGAYRHYIPAAVRAMSARSEFVTAYTPYQPEISQGSLQAMFEYQTMMTQLTGLPVSNASMYDGAMAAAEAALLAVRATRNKVILVSKALNPAYRSVLKTYTSNLEISLVDLPVSKTGQTDTSILKDMNINTVAGVMLQTPNMLGLIEDMTAAGNLLSQSKALLLVVVTEALSLAALKPPGQFGADVVCGEAQSLGLPVSFGGPYLGFFTVSDALVRKMPGRVVGLTKDTRGKCGFVNTLSTREQHIRRDKATSNICTNQALCAITAAMYMTSLGPRGLQDVAMLNIKKTAYLKSRLASIKGLSIPFDAPVFNEFTVVLPGPVDALQTHLLNKGIVAGYNLQPLYPELGHAMLICATETNTADDIHRFVSAVAEWVEEVS